jgi:hypothetical protein
MHERQALTFLAGIPLTESGDNGQNTDVCASSRKDPHQTTCTFIEPLHLDSKLYNMAKELADYTVTETPYPARTNTSSATIKGADTTATCVYFSDKIFITVTQNGRLGHWVHLPLLLSPSLPNRRGCPQNPRLTNTIRFTSPSTSPQQTLPSHRTSTPSKTMMSQTPTCYLCTI